MRMWMMRAVGVPSALLLALLLLVLALTHRTSGLGLGLTVDPAAPPSSLASASSPASSSASFWDDEELGSSGDAGLQVLVPTGFPAPDGNRRGSYNASAAGEHHYLFLRVDAERYPGEMFLHVHVPKTGGTALLRALNRRNCGLPSYSYNATTRCRAVEHARRLAEEQRAWWNSSNAGGKGGGGEDGGVVHRSGVPRPRCSVYSFEFDSLPMLLEALPAQEDRGGGRREGGGGAPAPRLLTMVRQPMLHLLSVHRHIRKYLKLRRCAALADLVSGRCTLRRFDNMQTRQLGGPAPSDCSPANSTMSNRSNTSSGAGARMLATAVANLRGAFWVGVFEYFDASMCLLSLQLGQLDRALCSCEARAQRARAAAPPGDTSSSGSSSSSSSDMSGGKIPPPRSGAVLLPHSMRTNRSRVDSAELPVVQAAQEGLLHLDSLLYHAATRLFVRRARAAERRHGVRVLCPGMDDPLASLLLD